ncbi:amidase [Roseisalinus antarcticus]|uniref:Glutamyl-tRNA(Gln) amidotransferase subunit A n=1 Tax=Roseisalinus antarcticus TaxID=254357 RepID=A0A1Y5SLF5_9RHOB|nr:amidase family protein [Roseisalinus antarcticus]SLN42920.1 Glutamyl-tRNA(Gln) amidotransferase subunit A [Roseisalinus antarcticus]
MEDWLWATAADLGRGIEAGEIDPVALTRVYLDAIDSHPLASRIYARTTPERAVAEALAAEARAKAGQRLSLLDGVPISWKDLVDTAGTGCEAGTPLIAGRVPEADARVVRNATSMGLVCLGKTHLSEIAFSGLGLNPNTATPPCVNDADAVPGGSSSGAATSVAFGLASAGIGSDTGGSVRVPSAWNDLVGLKTTHGLLSNEGVVPLCATFDTIGPLTRSVEDAALLLQAMGGPGTDLRGASLDGARLLVIETTLMEDLEDAPRAAFQSAVERLQNAGATVTRADWAPLTEAYALAATVFTADAWSYWGPMVAADGDKMFYHIRDRVSAGKDVLAADYIVAWRRLRELRAAYAAFTASFDAVISPSAALMPPKVERLLADDAYYIASNLKTLRNTRLGNLMGLCGLSLPTGVPSTGIMFSAAPMQEARLLRLGAAAEAALA